MNGWVRVVPGNVGVVAVDVVTCRRIVWCVRVVCTALSAIVRGALLIQSVALRHTYTTRTHANSGKRHRIPQYTTPYSNHYSSANTLTPSHYRHRAIAYIEMDSLPEE